MRKILIAFILLSIVSISSLAEEKKNQISILGGINAVSESGSVSDYAPGFNDFPVTPGHKNTSFAFSYARFISSNLGVELDFRYHLGTEVTLTDPSDQESVAVDTLNNYSVTGNILCKFSSDTVQPYVAGGVGMNVLSPYEKEFTSDRGSVIIITAPEKTSNLIFNVGAGLIIGQPAGLRLDVRYASISNIDASGIQFFAGIAFKF